MCFPDMAAISKTSSWLPRKSLEACHALRGVWSKCLEGPVPWMGWDLQNVLGSPMLIEYHWFIGSGELNRMFKHKKMMFSPKKQCWFHVTTYWFLSGYSLVFVWPLWWDKPISEAFLSCTDSNKICIIMFPVSQEYSVYKVGTRTIGCTLMLQYCCIQLK